MAKYLQDNHSKKITATNLDNVPIIAHEWECVSNPDNELYLKKILNVGGSEDRANSVLIIKQSGKFSRDLKIRVKEWPSELQDVFNKAGIPSPDVRPSVGRAFRLLRSYLGFQPY